MFAPPPLGVLDAGDADELRVLSVPLFALVVVDVAPAFVVVGAAFVVDVDDDVFARAFDDDEDDEEFGDDDMSIAAGEDPWFRPRVFSFQVSLPLSDLLDENSCLKPSLPCLLCGRANVSSEACAEVLGVGSGSRLTRVMGGSGVSVPFSVGSSLLADDDPEDPVLAAELLAVAAAPTLLVVLVPLLMLPLPLTSL